MFAYGSRCAVWRVLRTLREYDVDPTIFACALALERMPELAQAIRQGRSDVCCHGWRWEDHIAMDEVTERDRIARAVASLKQTLGSTPTGWYCRTAPSVNTRRLLVEHGGFVYDSDAYDDDLPYWTRVPVEGTRRARHNHRSRPDDATDFHTVTEDTEAVGSVGVGHDDDGHVWHLVVPYTLTNNDSKFAPGRAFSTADDFYVFMRDALDTLVREAETTGKPKMMSVGLHPRLIGHPARIAGLARFLNHVRSLKDKVWTCRRVDIATHWRALHPPPSYPPNTTRAQTNGLNASTPHHSSACHRLLVTGGAGFVLAHVVAHWLDTQPASSTAVIFDLARAWDGPVQGRLGPYVKQGRLAFFAGSVASPPSWDELAVRHGTGFTHIVAGAALTPTADEEHRLASMVLDVNYRGVLLAIEWARQHCQRLLRFVHISSDAVLGVPGLVSTASEEGPVTDRGVLPGMSVYALAKVAGEATVRRWRELYGMDTVTVRFSDVYGALDRDTGARNRHNGPYWMCRKALRLASSATPPPPASSSGALATVTTAAPCHPSPIVVAGDSLDDVGWDIVDAPSVARGVVAVLQHPQALQRGVYHLGLGRTPTHREVLAAVLPVGTSPESATVLQSPTALTVQGGTDAGGSTTAAVMGAVDLASLPSDHWLLRDGFDVKPMKDELGWEATPLKDALYEYMQHLAKASV
eukprot:m.213564 g.213564  ORF g.213564 m.213564 type:complete len:695 (+) comp26708_c0_seq1:378-2462(+)